MTALLRFFGDASKATWIKILGLSAISAGANAAILALVNNSISRIGDASQFRFTELFGFLIAIGCFGYAHKALVKGTTKLVESSIYSMRVRLLERLQAIDLRSIEKLNIEQIYVCINTEMQVVGDAVFTFAAIGEQLLILVFTLLYLAWLSIVGFLCAVMFVCFAAMIHLRHNSAINRNYQNTFEFEENLTEKFAELLHGFKEVKLFSPRATELRDGAKRVAWCILESKVKLNQIVGNNRILSQIAYFTLVMAIVFALPLVGHASGSGVAMAAVSALFLIGPAFSVINAIPFLQKISAAAEAILSVESRLGEAATESEVPNLPEPRFERISMRNVTYAYGTDPDSFQFGPVDLDIQRGQIVFISGVNGSGKSTLLKLLTGLYLPRDGELRLNEQLVTSSYVPLYQTLFSAIFSDNYLFKTLYGIAEPDHSEIAELLRLMEIERETSLVGKTFSTTKLSTGQRKRLAMIALVLERRPICVFDEWAADQDVHFRRKFYNVILPWLRTMGKTVIAVTHDESYFDVADQRIHLDAQSGSRADLHSSVN